MPQVFISYSQDSQEHSGWVFSLADRLRNDGIGVSVDQLETSPPEGWPMWMDRQIREADYVLIVCTEGYLRSVQGTSQRDGKGVRWEALLIYQQIYDAGSLNTRFIPVLPPGGSPEHIPIPLRSAQYYRPEASESYENLCRRVLGANEPEPEHAIEKPAAAARTIANDLPIGQPRFSVQELPPLGGRIPQNIAALNDAGQVAGDSHCEGGMSHAFWQDRDLILPGDEHSFAYDLSDAGQVVGLSARSGGSVRAFVFRLGQLDDISGITGDPSVAYGVNNLGAVVGSACLNGRFDAFCLEGGTLRLLGSPSGSPAKRITDSGLIAGDGWICENGRWTEFGFGSYVNTYGLNNSGQIVGQAGRRPDEGRAFVYQSGKIVDLGDLGGKFSRANAINDRGEIVGYSTTTDGSPRAFLYDRGVRRDLNSLIVPDTGWVLEVASAINNRGQIAGSGRLNGQFRAFLMRPLPGSV